MPIRWGIVTAAKICNDFVNAFNSYPDKGDVVIAAVAARDKTKAAAFAKQHNIPQVFDSYQALAASDAIGKSRRYDQTGDSTRPKKEARLQSSI